MMGNRDGFRGRISQETAGYRLSGPPCTDRPSISLFIARLRSLRTPTGLSLELDQVDPRGEVLVEQAVLVGVDMEGAALLALLHVFHERGRSRGIEAASSATTQGRVPGSLPDSRTTPLCAAAVKTSLAA